MKQIEPIKVVPTPFEIMNMPKYRDQKIARIIKLDHDRTIVLDFLLSNLYKAFL